MRAFAVEVFLPNYTPEQALQMHMDEQFQAAAAEACAASRSVEHPGFVNGNCFERRAIFDSHGDVPEGYFRQLFQNATPRVQYREISRYFAPPAGTVDIEILAPTAASECVNVHVDLMFTPAQGGGTIRTLQGQVSVGGWMPRLFRGMGERLIASQLETRLGVGAAYAQNWAVANPYRYPSVVRPEDEVPAEAAATAAPLAEVPAELAAESKPAVAEEKREEEKREEETPAATAPAAVSSGVAASAA